MKTKLNRLEKDNEDVKEELEKIEDKYVTHQHFNAVIQPIATTLTAVQKDIKEILKLVSGGRKDAHRP